MAETSLVFLAVLLAASAGAYFGASVAAVAAAEEGSSALPIPVVAIAVLAAVQVAGITWFMLSDLRPFAVHMLLTFVAVAAMTAELYGCGCRKP